MEPRDFDEIERFLASVGQAGLLAYYGLERGSGPDEREAALKRRRAWAQGQQSNPKFKAEALFLIKNNAMLRRALVEEPEDYARILEGLPAPAADPAGAPGSDEAPLGEDLYRVLQVDPETPQAELEAAYRARYKWARNLNDMERSQAELRRLDAAWRVLGDTGRRGLYDAERAELVRRQAPVIGLLGPGRELTPPADPGAETVVRAPLSAPSGALKPVVRSSEPRPPAPPAPPVPPLPAVNPTLLGEDERSDPRGPPPPPPGALGRTIGVGAGPVDLGRRAPRLVLVGAESQALSAGARPSLLVRNAGAGRMPGRVSSDRPWLEVTRADLDPAAPEQTIPLTFRPDRVPWGSDTATVTVVADHGERRALSFHARRVPWAAFAAAFFTFVVLVAVFVAIFAYVSRPTPRADVVTVVIRPRADHVFLNGTEVGSGSRVEAPLPEKAEQVKLRVVSDGFAPWEKPIPVTGTPLPPVQVELTLTDRMDWAPPADLPRKALTPAADRILDAAAPELSACYAGIGAPAEVTAQWQLLVTPEGEARNLVITGANFGSPAAEQCVRGVVRSLEFPPIAGGYGYLERKMSIRASR